MKFEQPDQGFFSKYGQELERTRHNYRIVKHRNSFWYIKVRDNTKIKELITAKLGSFLRLNAVEIICINKDDLNSLKEWQNSLVDATIENTYLVRLGQSYAIDELPIKDLDEAVASELIFSMWIRRRDTHLDNRVYVDGIPLFYDFHVAFDARLKNVNDFFNHGKNEDGTYRDKGYAGSWRVKIDSPKLETLSMRRKGLERDKTSTNYHFIGNKDNFIKQLHKYRDKIGGLNKGDIERQTREYTAETGINNNEEIGGITQLLISTKETIKGDCNILEKRLFSDPVV